MAKSPAHKFGQLIGELLEKLAFPELEDFSKRYNLFLDCRQKDRKARKGKKVSWTDKFGNIHDLDFVLESGGSENQIGRPVAFIECAWRRYTRHSRNKAQEIQGAILPLAENHKFDQPFLGVIVAGFFTGSALVQLESLGFVVLNIPYDSIINAFAKESINIRFNNSTPDSDYALVITEIENLQSERIRNILRNLVEENQEEIKVFFDALRRRLERIITRIVIIPLYGKLNEFVSVHEALQFLDNHKLYEGSLEFQKYEIRVKYSNGDELEANFESKEKIKDFLGFISK